MAKAKPADTSTFQHLETDAYNAFKEWPLFLVLKIKQREQQVAAANENIDDAAGTPADES